MNWFIIVLLVAGFAFAVMEIAFLIRDIKRKRKKKKEEEVSNDGSGNEN